VWQLHCFEGETMKLKNNKALCILSFCIFFICLTTKVFSLNTGNIIAYPVPFNPNIHNNLKIDKIPPEVTNIKIEIFDINGDSVFSRGYASTNIIWNGRNNNGKIVKPGLYIIKITLETATGDYGKKIIRILVNR
jgi:hypothetical protein